jgi:hypothetical protein
MVSYATSARHAGLTDKAALRGLAVFLCVILYCPLALASCAGGEASEQEFTAEYLAFLDAREINGEKKIIQENAGGYIFTLENGLLHVAGEDGGDVWQSNPEWFVDAFQTGDVNRDGITDVVFTVWKSFSFGDRYPARMKNDDAAVRCHLFVYSVKDNKIKALWCSSNLPRPLYGFTLDTEGEQTPALSGVRLVALEGVYTEDYKTTESVEYTYLWNGWGFSPED